MNRLCRPTARRTLAVAAGAIALAAARRQSLRWGATDSELEDVMPGDELLASAELVSTRGISIQSPPSRVWPWIAQLGQGRGGFYSYDFLENLMGCDIHSADTVVDAWQDVEVGDEVRLHPQVLMTVSVVDPGRALVLRGAVPMGESAPPYDMTWAFVLHDEAGGGTRLLVRERYQYLSRWAAAVIEPVELVSLLMSQRMLRGIKARAEQPKTKIHDAVH